MPQWGVWTHMATQRVSSPPPLHIRGAISLATRWNLQNVFLEHFYYENLSFFAILCRTTRSCWGTSWVELKAIPWSLVFCELTKVFRKTSKINQRWASALEILLLLRCMFIFNILSNSIMAASSIFILISGSDPLDNFDHYHLIETISIQLVRLIGCVYFHLHPEELARSQTWSQISHSWHFGISRAGHGGFNDLQTWKFLLLASCLPTTCLGLNLLGQTIGFVLHVVYWISVDFVEDFISMMIVFVVWPTAHKHFQCVSFKQTIENELNLVW